MSARSEAVDAVAEALCLNCCGPAGLHHSASDHSDAAIAVEALVALGWTAPEQGWQRHSLAVSDSWYDVTTGAWPSAPVFVVAANADGQWAVAECDGLVLERPECEHGVDVRGAVGHMRCPVTRRVYRRLA